MGAFFINKNKTSGYLLLYCNTTKPDLNSHQ